MLECTTEVNYRIKRTQDPVSLFKVVHFVNIKLYQHRHPEVDVHRRNPKGERGSPGKEGEVVLESPEGSGTICLDDLIEDRDVHELPDFCLPIPEPVATGCQVIQDPDYDGILKADDHQPETTLRTANEVKDID